VRKPRAASRRAQFGGRRSAPLRPVTESARRRRQAHRQLRPRTRYAFVKTAVKGCATFIPKTKAALAGLSNFSLFAARGMTKSAPIGKVVAALPPERALTGLSHQNVSDA
jgi:hypothetical protein